MLGMGHWPSRGHVSLMQLHDREGVADVDRVNFELWLLIICSMFGIQQ